MKKVLLIGALALFGAVNPSQARIGYTYEECVARYGPATPASDAEGSLYRFRVGSMNVKVRLHEGYVYSITYKAKDLSREDVASLLEKNKPGSWSLVPDPPTPMVTKYGNGDLMAYDGLYFEGLKLNQYLCIEVLGTSDRLKAQRQAVEENARKAKADRERVEQEGSLSLL
jgi:hypothetical protein